VPEFIIDAPGELLEYFGFIADRMVEAHHVSRAEAVARINCHWRDQTFSPTGRDLVTHGMPEYWADIIYYEEYFEAGRIERRPKQRPSPDSGCWTVGE
jgi:hypothetical protein